MTKTSIVLFYIVAGWCVAVGSFDQLIDGVEDLPWVKAALAGTDTETLDPILAIWAHWIGMFLIASGVTLGLLASKTSESSRLLLAASILAIGTVGAQSYAVISLGAFGPIVYALLIFPMLAILAAIFGFLGRRT